MKIVRSCDGFCTALFLAIWLKVYYGACGRTPKSVSSELKAILTCINTYMTIFPQENKRLKFSDEIAKDFLQ